MKKIIMKYYISLFLVMTMLRYTAYAEQQSMPEDASVFITNDRIGAETICRMFDRDFYEAECPQPRTLVKLKYKTTAYGDELDRSANVYLPYGYDPDGEQRYPILYFLHGNEGNQASLIGSEWVKNSIDNMIMVGAAEPFILVAPTYYYTRKQLVDMDRFLYELRDDLMPAVESTYHTYAPTADDEGFKASRTKRALCGYSRGSMNTWNMMDKMIDYMYWFMPYSGAIAIDADGVESARMIADRLNAVPEEYSKHFFIYAACGTVDTAYDGCAALVAALTADTEHFSYGTDPAVNNLYFCLSEEDHRTIASRFYFYNAFGSVLFKVD